MAAFGGRSTSPSAEAMSANTAELKVGLRQQIRESLKKLSSVQRAADSEKIRHLLQVQPIWINARAVLLFVPSVLEPDIRRLLVQALADGKSVALPRFSAES